MEKHKLDAKDLLLELCGVFEKLNNEGEAYAKNDTKVYSIEISDKEVTASGTKQWITGKKCKFMNEDEDEEEEYKGEEGWTMTKTVI